jgi:ppGpp synthetase/RelA/SpoT-type nucleotidyltranferase
VLADADLEELRVLYKDARPAYEKIVDHVTEVLKLNVAQRGVSAAAFDGRTKDSSSLVKKAMRKGYANPWTDIRDKAGVRVTTVTEDDIVIIEKVVRDQFEVVKYEDKRTTLEPNELGYLGVHFEVLVAIDVNLEPGDKICEVQIRTGAQTAWANVAHDLLFKAPIEPSPALQRNILRLIALAEIFDAEALRWKVAILNEPGFALGRFIAGLESEFLKLTARTSDPELSRLMIEALDPLLPEGGWNEYVPVLHSFVEEHEDKLRRIYDDYLEDDRLPLVSQPESLVVFEQLQHDRFRLVERWRAVLPGSLLESMSEAWGTPVEV